MSEDFIEKSIESVPVLPNLSSITASADTDLLADDEERYLSPLYNIKTSASYKTISNLKGSKGFSDERISKLHNELSKLHSFLISISGIEKEMEDRLKVSLQESVLQLLEQDRDIALEMQSSPEIEIAKNELFKVKIQNEVELSIEREQALEKELKEYLKTKRFLVHDIEEIRRHKIEMLEPGLATEIKDLMETAAQRNQELETLKKDLEDKKNLLNNSLSERDKAESDRERLSLAYSRSSETPIRLKKQIEELNDVVFLLTAENQTHAEQSLNLDKELETAAKSKKEIEELSVSYSAAYEELRGLISQLEVQLDESLRDFDYAKESLLFQKTEKVRLELAQQKNSEDLSREHESFLIHSREKDCYLKLHRRLELAVNNMKSSMPQTLKLCNDLKQQLIDAEMDENYYLKEANQLRQLIDDDTLRFLKQQQTTKSELDMWEKQIQVTKALAEEVAKISILIGETSKEIDSLKVDKGLQLRDNTRATAKVRSIKNEHSIKDITLSDVTKTNSEVTARVKDFMTLFELVKTERSKMKHKIYTSNQKVAGLRQKLQSLIKEIDTLRNSMVEKSLDLSKKMKQAITASLVKDTHQNEYSRMVADYGSCKEQMKNRLLRIEHLNSIINADEEELVKLKAFVSRDEKEKMEGHQQLLQLNKEVCNLQERAIVLHEVQRSGECALSEGKDEMRKLELIHWELVRRMTLNKRLKPVFDDSKTKISQLRLDRNALQEKLRKLSFDMENSEDPTRRRNLAGLDPSIEVLKSRIANLESTLCSQEERLLEKDLILDEVSALSTRLLAQVGDRKDESELINTSINNCTKKVKTLTRKMMAKVSELSMYQASAVNLQREKIKKEYLLKESLNQIETGNLPIEELETELIRIKAKEKTQMLALQRLRQKQLNLPCEQDDNFRLLNGTKTSAAPRPNAYVPVSTISGQLPIPKPFGGNAPFKPQEQGAQMRYLKRAELKF